MAQSTRWYYHFPGSPYAYGPTTETYTNEKAVREMLRESWGYERLPYGTQIWRA